MSQDAPLHLKWEQLSRRLVAEAQRSLRNSHSGCVLITVHVVVEADGEPMFWLVSDGKRIEPAKNAKQILKTLVGLE